MEKTEQQSHNPYAAPTSLVAETASESISAGLFSFSGRISRLRYATRIHGLGVLIFVALMTGSLIFMLPAIADPEGWAQSADLEEKAMIFGAAVMLTTLVALLVSILWAAQRLRDMDISGGFAFLSFVPLANLALMLFLLFNPGNLKENRFGPVPVQINTALAVIVIGLGLACLALMIASGVMNAQMALDQQY